MKVAVIGHSFVRRLEVFCNDIGENLHPEHQVSYHGRSGSKTETLFSMVDDIPESTHLIYIQSGGNDINPNRKPESIAQELLDLADHIQNTRGIPVLIGSVFVRTKPRYQSSEDYDEARQIVNKMLKHMLKCKANCMFARHERFFRDGPKKPHLLDDGVHLNDTGQRLFMLYIRKTIDQALKKYYNLNGPNLKIKPELLSCETSNPQFLKRRDSFPTKVPYKKQRNMI